MLIVDDEPKIRAMLAESLKQDGLVVTMAESGEEAMTKIAAAVPDLVMLDVKMKGMSGLDVLKRLRPLYPNLAVLLITGFDDEHVEEEAKQYGALGVIHKPLMLAEVRHVTQTALANLPASS